ncbi:MAG: ABC transporter permease subunit [Anaerolinea sp.]|nr:ABC transporter permease subunit [Anaerolinea sp.]MCC6973531.1 ABC transporter permease subunit [Anaerolineae bacterium]
MMIDLANIRTLAEKELRDALRNRWFLVFTIAFAGLALVLSSLTQPGGMNLRTVSYSRTAASLINLVLLFVPLIGLTLGAANLAGDRETGALIYLLSQPVNRVEVLLGKFLGIAGALLATLSLGFGLAGVVLSLRGGIQDSGGYLFTVLLAYLLALAMLGLGFLLSSITQRTAAALGGSLFVWLFLVFIGDLGIMGTVASTQLPIGTVFLIAVLNPLQLFKIASILVIQANLEVLGPAGLYASDHFGGFLLPLLIGGLVLWIFLPLLGAVILFGRQERLVQRGKTNP